MVLLTPVYLTAFEAARPTGMAGECHLWGGRMNKKTGYGVFAAANLTELVHRASWVLDHNQQIPPGLVIRHRCDVKLCANGEHHIIGTHADNTHDAIERGLWTPPAVFPGPQPTTEQRARGERNNKAKLTEDTVRQVRTLHADGASAYSLGKKYGVSKQAILFVVKRKTWTHVV